MMAKRYPTSFAERNKVVIALVGIAAMVGAFVVTFNAEAMPIIGGGQMYSAQFAEAGGLKPGNEVRVAGVKVGEVTDITLDGATVDVAFRAKDVRLGSETTASVKVKTLLGQKYLALDPAGSGSLDRAIALDHTTTPYDVNAAFSDLSDTVDEIDTEQLEESFDTLADAFQDTPKSVRGMVDGLTALSRTISTRDDELAKLFASTAEVSGTLAARNDELGSLVDDSSSLLTELADRREAVEAMLTGTQKLSKQVKGLIKENERQLQPALDKLDQVTAILQRNQANLDAALKKIGPYYRMLASAMGNGRWVDTYLCGLFNADQRPVLENDVVRNCEPASGGKP